MDDDCTSQTFAGTGRPTGPGHHLHKPLLLESENVHGPVDPWFYRRLVHSKGNGGKILSSSGEPEVAAMSQGPPYYPLSAQRLADYF